MKDIDKLKKLLTEFGVGFTEEKHRDGDDILECYQGDSNIKGYNCFYTQFIFDKDGSFKHMGAWE
ncbi:hypothetical protein KAR91_06140 [Candidatus Pacearchaeota archaeon]|nr:hypothetical protein [Candidatus Pacearchaeota archaeon]